MLIEKIEQNKTLEEIEQNKTHIENRMKIAQKKIDILKKKLDECKKKNLPLPPEVCDTKPLNMAEKELQRCKEALVHLGHAEQIRSWKKGDAVLCFSTGDRAVDRETGFRDLEYDIALDRIRKQSWRIEHLFLTELTILDRRTDGRILAKNQTGKKQFLGVPTTRRSTEWDSDLGKDVETVIEDITFYRLI